jgi:hypothetical protein
MDRSRGARSTVDRWWREPKAPEHGGALTGAWPPATPVHGSSPTGAQQREGSTGNSARASPGLGRLCGDRATAGKWRRREGLATVILMLRKRGKSEMGEVRWSMGARRPIYRAGGGVPRRWTRYRPVAEIKRGRKWGKILFWTAIWFLNIPRLWKFVGGDLGRILTWGFFLNSSRLLKYFRKMKYAMPCYATLGKIN